MEEEMNLLDKTRKINAMLQQAGGKHVNFGEMAESLSDVIDANAYIVNHSGKLLSFYVSRKIDNQRMLKMLEDNQFPMEYTENLSYVRQTTSNLTVDSELTAFPVENKEFFKEGLTTIIPILGSGERLGTLVLARFKGDFKEDDLILGEYGATVVAMEILRERTEQIELETRRKQVVQMAISTLSYSELEAIDHIFEELEGMEGLLVASKIADRVGITRSVIVNALRKLESAGVIESRSLGMKGTYIRILNSRFLDELHLLKSKK